MSAAITGLEPGQMYIHVDLGSELLDGSWHTACLNLQEAVAAAIEGYNAEKDTDLVLDEWQIVTATDIVIVSRMSRLDNIIFRVNQSKKIDYPTHLFKIGPRYARIFEPYRYLFFADYRIGDYPISSILDFLISEDFSNVFITDPNEIARVWMTEYGADPDRFGSSADPQVSAILGRDFVIDPQLPIFANPDFRLGKNPHLADISSILSNKTLDWHITSIGLNTEEFVVNPLEIDPYDGMPTYMPVYYALEHVFNQYNKTFFGPEECLHLECALWNAGFTLWPNVAKFDFNPASFDDIILTIEVSNGVSSDQETFPISVVNYPVTNYAPHILGVENLLFYTGEEGSHVFGIIDPDCMIFSMSDNPEASHKSGNFEDFRNDMDALTWEIHSSSETQCMMWWPWSGCSDMCNMYLIDDMTGMIRSVPRFEQILNDLILSANDQYGGTGIAEFNLFFVHRGGFNHPPIVLKRPAETLVVNAGEEIVLQRLDFIVEDPDGDQVYLACNVGTWRRTTDGSLIWKFQNSFPGLYDIEIICYDPQGNCSAVEFQVDVQPWWRYKSIMVGN